VPKFLIEANYTLEGIRGVAEKGGTARKTAIAAAIKSVGGKLESLYFGFGSTDAYVIFDAPDNEAAAALALTVASSGAVSIKTIVLLTPTEIDNATSKKVGYRPPGS
jgi:uncharacterized protein with GYD domain